MCVSCCVFAAPRGADTHAVAMRARLSCSPRARLRHLVAGLNHLPCLVYAWKVAPISPLTEIIVRCGGMIRHFSTKEMLKCNCAALSHGITEDGGAEHGNYSRRDVTGVLDVGPLLSPATRACVVLPSRSACCVSLFMFACKNRVGSWRKVEGGAGGGGGVHQRRMVEGIKEEMGENEQEREAHFAPCEDQPYWESASEIFNRAV